MRFRLDICPVTRHSEGVSKRVRQEGSSEMAKRLEVAVTYTDGTTRVLPDPEVADEIGRKVTGKLAFDLMARSNVLAVKVTPVTRYAGGRKGTYR